MSRVGNPYDNAKAESFMSCGKFHVMKTLKTEEVAAKVNLGRVRHEHALPSARSGITWPLDLWDRFVFWRGSTSG
jgi:transposase InsO family protein